MKKAEREVRDKQIREYVKTHTYKEASATFGLNRKRISEICAGMRQGYDPEESINGYLEKFGSGFSYVSGFVGISGSVVIRCKRCGLETERSMETIRHTRVRCRSCYQRDKEERKKTEKEERLKEKALKKEQSEIKRKIREEELKAQRKEKHEAQRHECPICGEVTVRRKYCSDKCARKAYNAKHASAHNARHEATRRTKIKANIVDKDITLKGLYEREGGVCWICGMVCDYNDFTRSNKAFIAGNLYPSIDHVVALSNGGEHSWNNVKLAHRICNVLRFYSPLLQRKL